MKADYRPAFIHYGSLAKITNEKASYGVQCRKFGLWIIQKIYFRNDP